MFLVVSDGAGWDSEEEALGARGPVQVFIQVGDCTLPWDRKGDEAFVREGQSLWKDLRFGLNARPSFSQCFSNSLTLLLLLGAPKALAWGTEGEGTKKAGLWEVQTPTIYLNRKRFLGLGGTRIFSTGQLAYPSRPLAELNFSNFYLE